MIGNTDIRRIAHLVTVDDLVRFLPHLQKILAINPDAVVTITHNGKPVMALLPWESWEDTEDAAATMETLEVLDDAEVMAAIRPSEAGTAAGTYVSGETVLQQLIDEGLIDEVDL